MLVLEVLVLRRIWWTFGLVMGKVTRVPGFGLWYNVRMEVEFNSIFEVDWR